MQVQAPFEPAIVARDMKRMLKFYRDVLGMRLFSLDEISADTARRAGLSATGYTIARLETSGADRLKIVVPEHAPPAPEETPYVMERSGFVYLTFIVPDVRAVIARIRAADGRVRTGEEPVDFRPGVVQLAFAEDPEGNYLEFVQRNDLSTYRPKREGAA